MSPPPRPPWHTPAHCPLPCPSTTRLSEESAAGRCRKGVRESVTPSPPPPDEAPRPAPPRPRSGPPRVHPETLRISASLGLIFSNQRTGLGGNALSGAGRGGPRAPGCSWGSVGRGGGVRPALAAKPRLGSTELCSGDSAFASHAPPLGWAHGTPQQSRPVSPRPAPRHPGPSGGHTPSLGLRAQPTFESA